MGRLHAGYYVNHPAAQLVGISDVDESVAAPLARTLGCEYHASNLDLIGLVDAVSIAVPATEHRHVTAPFIDAGVHVLMEKPLAASVKDGRRLVDLAKANDTKLVVVHQERFNAAAVEVSKRLEGRPMNIEVKRYGHHGGRNDDVDVIVDLMIHDIDLILSWEGSPIEQLVAMGSVVSTGHVDDAYARIAFESGTVADVFASRVSQHRERIIKIDDGENRYRLDMATQTASYTTSENGEEPVHEARDLTGNRDAVPRQTLGMQISHFMDVLTKNVTPLVGGDEGLAALQVAERIASDIELA